MDVSTRHAGAVLDHPNRVQIHPIQRSPGYPLGLRLIGNSVDTSISSTGVSEYLLHAREGYIRGVSIYYIYSRLGGMLRRGSR